MFVKYIRQLWSFLHKPVPENNRHDFNRIINELNIARAKLTSATFIGIEVLLFFVTLLVKQEKNLDKQDIYYMVMYISMILAMTIFLLTFIRLGKNVSAHPAAINVAGTGFIAFILLWCAGISLLDQLSGGGILVYTVAVVAVAVTPLFHPALLLIIYLVVQAIFLFLLPSFNISGRHLFGSCINSSVFIAISWMISYMRYRNKADDFRNRKEIEEKNAELKRLNNKLEEANRKLQIISQTDSLTGIFNRSVFDSMLMKQWSECKDHNTYLSLIMIDVDYFKAYNDNYGHQAGDECLRRAADVLSQCVGRTSGAVIRYGGEEFAVILPGMDQEKAYELAQRMRKGVEDLHIPHEYSAVTRHLTISVGVCTVIPSDRLSVEELIRTADKALYEAKNEKRNMVVAV